MDALRGTFEEVVRAPARPHVVGEEVEDRRGHRLDDSFARFRLVAAVRLFDANGHAVDQRQLEGERDAPLLDLPLRLQLATDVIGRVEVEDFFLEGRHEACAEVRPRAVAGLRKQRLAFAFDQRVGEEVALGANPHGVALFVRKRPPVGDGLRAGSAREVLTQGRLGVPSKVADRVVVPDAVSVLAAQQLLRDDNDVAVVAAVAFGGEDEVGVLLGETRERLFERLEEFFVDVIPVQHFAAPCHLHRLLFRWERSRGRPLRAPGLFRQLADPVVQEPCQHVDLLRRPVFAPVVERQPIFF